MKKLLTINKYIAVTNYILSITKIASNAILVNWSQPVGSYLSLTLVCTINGVETRVDYDNQQIQGICSQNNSISGYKADVYIAIKKTQNQTVTSGVTTYVVGKVQQKKINVK